MQTGILFTVVAAALLQNGYSSEISIKMPYLNPAGVTYIDHIEPSAHLAYAHAVPLQYAAAKIPASIQTHHVGYAAAEVPAVAAVPFIKHVPTVAHLPVTKYEAQPALLEKQVDVLKPAISTRKVEIRRPALQKQFYDIEERVIVRPAGSAILELDHPISKQHGPALIQPLEHNSHLQYPFQIAQDEPNFVSTTPAPETPSSPPTSNDESVVVENPNFRKVSTLPSQLSISNLPKNSFVAHDPTPTVVKSRESSPEENASNQNKLIELLTARGNVAEVKYGNERISASALGESGHLRTRVLSATPAPDNAEPADERVSTRRVVFTKPIETLQEVNVVEPATKIERVSVQQPTFVKTARLEHVQVHSSVPVVGKALTPTVAHAAVPVYQKTISPAYAYYH